MISGFLAFSVILTAPTLLISAYPSAGAPKIQSRSPLVHSLKNLKVTRDIVYAVVNGERLKLDVYEPRDSQGELKPILVHIHGGGWRSGDKIGALKFAPQVTNAGYILVAINYRFTDTAKFPAQIYDCKSAIRWIRKNAQKFGGDPNRIGVFGPSAGGHLSALLGTSIGVSELEGDIGVTGVSSDVQAVVDFFGPTDFTVIGEKLKTRRNGPVSELLGDKPSRVRKVAEMASPVTFVDSSDPPFLIIHGTDDPLLPIDQSRRLYQKLKDARVEAELIEVKGGKHGDFLANPVDAVKWITKMIEFFDRHLKGFEKAQALQAYQELPQTYPVTLTVRRGSPTTTSIHEA